MEPPEPRPGFPDLISESEGEGEERPLLSDTISPALDDSDQDREDRIDRTEGEKERSPGFPGEITLPSASPNPFGITLPNYTPGGEDWGNVDSLPGGSQKPTIDVTIRSVT